MFLICLTSTPAYAKQPDAEELERALAGIAGGGKEGLEMLYEQTKASVYGFALSILKNTHDAEDVLQETYIQVYGAAEGYRPLGKPMAWILTIARNLAYGKLREKKRTADFPEEDWERYFCQAPGMTEEDRLVLQTVMKSLEEKEMQVVMLHAVAGFRHREVAELLSLPLSTVLSKYHRAMKKLKIKLAEGEQ